MNDPNFWPRPENPNLRIVFPYRKEPFKFVPSVGGRWRHDPVEPYKSWLAENCRGLVGCQMEEERSKDDDLTIYRAALYFELERDAVLFKLFFADDLL